METTHTPLAEQDRRRVATAVWLLVAAAALALVGIFGFGATTGAGDYFDDATRDAAVRDHYWQIWGILLPIAIAVPVSGFSVFMLGGVLARMGSGWTAGVANGARWVVLPATALVAVVYLDGPRQDLPSWFEVVVAIAGISAYAAVAAIGVVIIGLSLPKWTGIVLILGALAAGVTFLPLFMFVGTLAGGIGILRWNRKGPEVASSTATVASQGR